MSRCLVLGDPVVNLGIEPYITDGALIVEGPSVVEVGRRRDLEDKGPFDRVIGSTDHFVLPGFVAGHYHSEVGVGPGIYDSLFEIANIYSHFLFKEMSEEDFYNAILVTLMQALRGGITCTVDAFYGRPGLPDFGLDVALQAYHDLGMRTGLGMTIRDQNLYVHEEDQAFLSRLPKQLAEEVRRSPMGYALPVEAVFAAYERVASAWDGRDDLIRVLLAPDWTPACSDELYRRCRRVANEMGTGIMTHMVETRSEMQFNIKRYGKTAMERLNDLGVLGPDMSLSHFVWATDRDIEILVDSGAVAVNDPGSNLRLSTGIARVRDIIAAGGKICFGTDAISFSDRDDFFQELRLGLYLQRVPPGFDARRLDSETILRAAAGNGAQAARFDGITGSLTAGKHADLLLVRKDRVFWPPRRYAETPVLDVILDRTDATDLDSVMIAGRLVLDGGVITTVNESQVRDAHLEATERGLFDASGAWARWLEIAREVEPYLIDFYRPWSEEDVVAGYRYNTTTGPAGFSNGASKEGLLP